MSLSTLKPATCRLPSVTGATGSHPNVSKVSMVNRQALPPLQVREKEKPLLQEGITTVPRREMMHLAAASLGFLSLLLLPTPAEARPRNATMRQKILEKLEKMREMAGFSKPKGESEGKDEKEEKLEKPKNETKEKKVDGQEKKPSTDAPKQSTTPNEPLLLPNIINDKTVETTFS